MLFLLEKSGTMCVHPFSLTIGRFSTTILLSPSSSAQTFTSEKFNPRGIARRNPFVKFCQMGDSSSNLSGRSPRKLGGIVSF